MATICVAYGGPGDRAAVLRFAAERAAAAGDDLFVYHLQESPDDDADDVRAEIDDVLQRTAPDVPVEVVVERRECESDETNVSSQKRLVDTITGADREFASVVMGDVERGAIESITLPSMTEAVLETRSIPVVLVPV